MTKVKFRVNLGSRDAEQLGLEFAKCTADAVAEVRDEIAARLVKIGAAVKETPEESKPKK